MTIEYVHLRPGDQKAECEIHDWPTEGLACRMVAAMRAAHACGGINVCADCVTRARDDARSRLTPEQLAQVKDPAYRTRHVRFIELCVRCLGTGQVCNACGLDGSRCVCPSSALPTPEPCSCREGALRP